MKGTASGVEHDGPSTRSIHLPHSAVYGILYAPGRVYRDVCTLPKVLQSIEVETIQTWLTMTPDLCNLFARLMKQLSLALLPSTCVIHASIADMGLILASIAEIAEISHRWDAALAELG